MSCNVKGGQQKEEVAIGQKFAVTTPAWQILCQAIYSHKRYIPFP